VTKLVLRTCTLLSTALLALPAGGRTTITPYVEAQQVVSTDLSGRPGPDTVTYSGLAAGIDATVETDKLQGQLDYRYDHYFAWSDRYRDTDLHNGLASLKYQASPDLTLQAAGIATRARGTLATGTSGLLFGDLDNTQQVYAVQAGPSYTHQFRDINLTADYRFGWTRSDNGFGSTDLGVGQPVIENNFDAFSHTADVAVGTRPGGLGLPFGWTVSGGIERDEVHFLDARYTSKFGRVDFVQPVSHSLALEAGIGYEADRATQSAILTDADGNAILDKHRHLQADHSKRRLLSYDQDGLVWDVGVLWRPSLRTTLEVRGGQRYGQTVVTGHLTHQLTPKSTIEVVAYDDITSFGRQLTGEIGALPTSFSGTSLPIQTPLANCVFGANGSQGGCLTALNSVNSNFYRSRGVYVLLAGQKGLWNYGLGVGYDNRHYLAPNLGANVFSFAGVNEESVTVDATIGRRLSRVSTLTLTGLAAWYNDNASVVSGTSYTSYGGILTYNREFSRRLLGTASVGVSSGGGGNIDDDVIGTALLALRYQL
jgi:hypothetical protein